MAEEIKGLTKQQQLVLDASRLNFTFHERILLARVEIGELELCKNTEGYNYKYITLDEILKQVTPILHKFGLVISFSTTLLDEGWHNVSCDIEGPDGSVKSTSLAFPAQHDAQGLGSWRTYLARYNANSILALSLEDDDDGESTAGNQADPKQKTPKKKYNENQVPAGDHEVTPTVCNLAKDGGSWKLYVIKCKEGDISTFSSTVAGVADECIKNSEKMKVRVEVAKNGKLGCKMARKAGEE